MIRRDVYSDRAGRQWSLISQPAHARLSGELAAAWGGPHVPPLLGAATAWPHPDDSAVDSPLTAVREEALTAIHHHDDGWAMWEASPGLDPAHGRPRSFLEMPQAEALAIWSASVAAGERIGPMAAWMIAGHFSALLETSSDAESPAHSGDDGERSAAKSWLAEMAARRKVWLAAWQARDPAHHTREVADAALRWLQFFDRLSLAICCELPSAGEAISAITEEGMEAEQEASELAIPDSSIKLVLRAVEAAGEPTPAAAPSASKPQRTAESIVVDPWPSCEERLELSVDSRITAAQAYPTSEQLLAACRPHRHTWRLAPG